MAEQKAVILDADGVRRALTRIAFEIIEKNKGVDHLLLAGIKTRGVHLAGRLARKLGRGRSAAPPVIELDVTPWRDDKPRTDAPASPARPAHRRRDRRAGGRCALHRAHGARCYRSCVPRRRAARIQLAVLVDRGHREIPIRPDYTGKNLPTSREERVSVRPDRGRWGGQRCYFG